jgi:RNA polymerase sigma-70 factor, ECF subfamily
MYADIDRQSNHEGAGMAEELDLIASLRRDESAAHEMFVWHYGQRLLATARRFLPCDQDCYDAVQEAFLAAFLAIHQFEGNSKLGTWLHRILVNVCLMKLRARSRRHEVSIEEMFPARDRSGGQTQWSPYRVAPSDSEVQENETRFLVRRCIDQLPDDFRSVLWLRDIEELDTATTAETLDISPGAVKTRLHRARQALRTLLEPHFV